MCFVLSGSSSFPLCVSWLARLKNTALAPSLIPKLILSLVPQSVTLVPLLAPQITSSIAIAQSAAFISPPNLSARIAASQAPRNVLLPSAALKKNSMLPALITNPLALKAPLASNGLKVLPLIIASRLIKVPHLPILKQVAAKNNPSLS